MTPKFIKFLICWVVGVFVLKMFVWGFIQSLGATPPDMSLLAFMSVLVWTVASLTVSLIK